MRFIFLARETRPEHTPRTTYRELIAEVNLRRRSDLRFYWCSDNMSAIGTAADFFFRTGSGSFRT